ncbi:Aste57867_14659 [Aphanomyces stellatus]|uniref:Aste57867_14659 protein n=1 Tax=Aphanomyces stellatus TaxID=120398 RepID=A0A485L1A3_9STRA|nr:hypothetical protein As57867_014604 [Aphanomyces stellatus]VFT91478.1 Aste57867_14659 [Aphanomyces stellatus]
MVCARRPMQACIRLLPRPRQTAPPAHRRHDDGISHKRRHPHVDPNLPYNGWCLDAYEPWNWGAVHLWPCSSSNVNHEWQCDTVTFQLRHLTHKGYCLDVGGPWLWLCLPTDHKDMRNQQWRLAAPGGRFQAHVVTLTGMVGTQAVTFESTTKNNATNHHWIVDATTNMVQLADTSLCLDAWIPRDGRPVHLWPRDAANDNQK